MKVSDCTLRDYFGSPLVNSSAADRVKIAKALAALGIEELEVGDPFSYRDDATLLSGLVVDVPLVTFMGAKTVSDLRPKLEFIKSLGVDGAVISIPASDTFANLKLPTIVWDYRFELVTRALEICAELGLYAVVTGEDSPSADIEYLKEYLRIAHANGATKFRYAESVSKSLPIATYQRIAELTAAVPCAQIEMHCHDMFGLGLANAIAGVEAGATWISGTCFGIGERGGNINTIDALAASKFLFGATQRRLETLTTAAFQLAELLDVAVPPSQRVIGKDCFAFEQPNQLRNQEIYLPFDPKEVGQSVSVLLSGKHRLESLQYIAECAGISYEPDSLHDADLYIRRLLEESGRPVDQEIAKSVIRMKNADLAKAV